MILAHGRTQNLFLKEKKHMEHDLLTRQQAQLLECAQGLASASDALATSMGADETAISPLTACELLTNPMNTIMTLSKTTEGLRGDWWHP